MLKTKLFASDYPRTKEGYIRFNPDKPYREALFHPESMNHPARTNLWMLQEIYRYVAKPGEVLLDVTSGVGSLMIAELEGYKTILIELSPYFHEMQKLNAERMEVQPIMLLGDCREYLPLSCDHIVFSPPYSTAYHKDARKSEAETKFKAWAEERNWQGYSGHEAYIDEDKRNLGLLNPFLFSQTMEGIYQLCLDSVRPGGTMSIILQNIIKGGKEEDLCGLAVRQCERMGWGVMDRFYRAQPGSPKKSLHKKLGHKTVDCEEILIFRKP